MCPARNAGSSRAGILSMRAQDAVLEYEFLCRRVFQAVWIVSAGARADEQAE